MPVIAQSAERYLRTPVLALREGGATLSVTAWERTDQGDAERVLTFDLDSDGQVVGEGGGGAVSALVDDSVFEAGGTRVVVTRAGYQSTVTLHRADGSAHGVWSAHATASAPYGVDVPGGTWVAFHHNLREDTNQADLAKWIALRFVDDAGRVFEPALPMTDRNRDQEGEEQSFEFPTLAVGADGAVAMFGRGSHRFWRQDVSAAGYASRTPLGDGTWGCRGRRVAVLSLPNGTVLTARREKPGIDLAVVPAPEGAAPALMPAVVHLPTTAPAAGLPIANDPAARDGRMTLFGDIHQHSAHSDGIGIADEPYLRARHLYGDDFCALTDHESFLGKRIGPGEWDYLQSVAEKHNEPGRFATLLAYEWTGRMHPGPGHKVVYLPRTGFPIHSRDVVREGVDIVREVKAQGGFAVPHHVGWTGADEGAHDVAGQPVWEICSCHGCYESFAHELGQRGELRDQMVDAVLRRGHRFGFIASSDGHGLLWHHGVARKRDPFRTGLTAVQSTARTREAILSALRERRCYATSGTKIILDFRVNDAPMGADLRVTGPIQVNASAAGTADIADFELVGPEGVVQRADGQGARATLGLKLPTAPAYLYVRLRQRDGEMAWSSPIFMESAAG